jgi:hydroxyethylthiazole kinase
MRRGKRRGGGREVASDARSAAVKRDYSEMSEKHWNPSEIWADIVRLRQVGPLVHNITNFVVMNFTANALLAVGASPVMAHAKEEVAEMAGIAQALVLNIGTLEPAWIDSMKIALKVASERPIPVVLDPVGAGATSYRNQAVADLMGVADPAVIRGNASEIMSVAGSAARTKGVDSASDAAGATELATVLAKRIRGVVCVSGATDYIIDDRGRRAALKNGDIWMTKVTGTGCVASALIGAFCAIQSDYWRATIAAMALLSVAGELAAEKVRASGAGVGSLPAVMIDLLQLIEEPTFTTRLHGE